MFSSLACNIVLCLGLLIGPTYGSDNDLTCEERGFVSCKLSKECYKLEQQCDGAWDCTDHSDEADCSTGSTVTREGRPFSKGQNLAWLVTPILLLLGAAYGVYKCVKDGVCTAIKIRLLHGRRNRESRASDYHPLHQVSFYTSTQIPCTQLGINPATLSQNQLQQMMLVHNQSFSIAIPNTEGGIDNEGRAITNPPTYEEAMSAMSDGKGGTIVMTKSGHVINIPNTGIMPPPYVSSTSRGANRNGPMAGPMSNLAHMEAIEEVSERDEESEDDDLAENADEQTFFLPKDSHGDGNVGGRRRHNSQWSNKRRSENRRRHHSCPS